jgi:hypothetical protein
MSFQAYLDNIHAKTGLWPDDFRRLADERGLLQPGLTATQLVDWLKADHGLGTGHARAIWEVCKSEGWIAGAQATTPRGRK